MKAQVLVDNLIEYAWLDDMIMEELTKQPENLDPEMI